VREFVVGNPRARATGVCSGGKRPTGKIPALSDDDFSVSDSVA
jgi:hypothetical protein